MPETNPYAELIAKQEARPSNPYLALIEDEERRRSVQQTATLTTALDSKPDEYAAQRRVAGFLGYPVAAVEATPDESQREAQLKQIQADTAPHPVLQRRYSDDDFAKLAHDDSGALAKLAGAVKASATYLFSADAKKAGLITDLLGAGVLDINRGAAGLFRAAAEVGAPVLEPLSPKFLGHSTNPLTQIAGFFAREGAASKRMADQLSPPTDSLIGGGVSAGVRSILPSVLGAATGNAALGTGAIATCSGGAAYLRERR